MGNGTRNGVALNEVRLVKTDDGRPSVLLFSLSVLLLLILTIPASAQSERTTDFGAILGAKYEGSLYRDLSIEVEEELRIDHGCAQFDRWLNSVTLEYPFLHRRMHVGLTGAYIRRHNDRGFNENRSRIGLDITYAETVRRFKLSYRSRVMATFRDESIGDYRVNPKIYWRHRIQATYQYPSSRFKYSLSTEIHWLVNDPKHSVVDNLRTVFTVDYRLARQHTISAFVRMDNDLQVNHPVDRFYLGLTYHYKN